MENILIETETKLLKLKSNEILYAKSDKCYIELFLTDGKKIMLSKLLKNFEIELNNHIFFRSHKSYIINTIYFKELARCKKGKFSEITLTTGHKIPLASRRINIFKEYLKKTAFTIN